MNDRSQSGVLEATRLTVAGQLVEATDLLQRLLCSEHFDFERGISGRPERPLAQALNLTPNGGEFINETYTSEAGSRTYRLFIPSRYRGQALPLVVMLHGCIQSPEDFAAGTRMNMLAEEQNCFVVYPAQCATANPTKSWNWFQPDHQRRDEGEPSLIAGITRQIMNDYAIDARRVYVAGFSAGAAAATIMGVTYPDLYAAIGVHSGLICGAANDLPSAFAAMRHGEPTAIDVPAACAESVGALRRLVPTIVFHGDRDTTVHPRNSDHVIAQSKSKAPTSQDLRTIVEKSQIRDGFDYSRTLHTDAQGRVILEQWVVHEAGHTWSGGCATGSFTDGRGPDASREMLRFFLEHRHPAAAPGA
jgi:poly(hydroxyalkanoate) depolymerase family esterase